MANSTGGAKKASGSAKKGAAPRSKTPAKKAQRPVRREIGAVVCAFLGIFSLIGYFDVQALFIDVFCAFIKGLLGWGYFLFPIALIIAAGYLPCTAAGPSRCA